MVIVTIIQLRPPSFFVVILATLYPAFVFISLFFTEDIYIGYHTLVQVKRREKTNSYNPLCQCSVHMWQNRSIFSSPREVKEDVVSGKLEVKDCIPQSI